MSEFETLSRNARWLEETLLTSGNASCLSPDEAREAIERCDEIICAIEKLYKLTRPTDKLDKVRTEIVKLDRHYSQDDPRCMNRVVDFDDCLEIIDRIAQE